MGVCCRVGAQQMLRAHFKMDYSRITALRAKVRVLPSACVLLPPFIWSILVRPLGGSSVRHKIRGHQLCKVFVYSGNCFSRAFYDQNFAWGSTEVIKMNKAQSLDSKENIIQKGNRISVHLTVICKMYYEAWVACVGERMMMKEGFLSPLSASVPTTRFFTPFSLFCLTLSLHLLSPCHEPETALRASMWTDKLRILCSGWRDM